jgi:pyruvate/oxaloacetate carboxyltransferase
MAKKTEPAAPKPAAAAKPSRVLITDTIFRDAHQSLIATRMRTEDMLEIAALIDQVGFWSVEMWGGATFDSCLRFLKEDPWERVRKLKAVMPKTRFQMLLRGQNLLGYRHYSDDVVRAFVKAAHAAGIRIFRVFDALNDLRNLECAIRAVKETGAHAEGCVSYTVSPAHTLEYFVEKARALEALGCDTFCIKDMAGLLAPYDSSKLVGMLAQAIRIPIHLHCHVTSGMATGAYLKGIEAGATILDTALSPFSGGTSQPATESFVAMLRGTPWDTGLDLEALSRAAVKFKPVRRKYRELEGEFFGVDTDVLLNQIPGGMMSNLVKQLKDAGALDKMDQVLAEVPRVRKELGYPPLVTPTSQIVGTQAALNVISGERYKIVPKETHDLVKGMYGRSVAPIDDEVRRRILGDEPPVEVRPADLLKPEMEKLARELGTDRIEDVLSYALFPEVAKEFFEHRKAAADGGEEPAAALAAVLARSLQSAPAPAARPSHGPRVNAWALAGRVERMGGRYR